MEDKTILGDIEKRGVPEQVESHSLDWDTATADEVIDDLMNIIRQVRRGDI